MSRSSTNQSNLADPGKAGLRERRRQENLTKILESASTVFSTHGFERTTMNMIAQKAQMGKASIYHYFPTKKLLFLEIIRQANEKLAQAVNKAVMQSPGRRPRDIGVILNAATKAFREQRALLGLFLTLHAGGAEHLNSLLGEEILTEIQSVHRPIVQQLDDLLGPDKNQLKPIVISFLLGLAVRVIHGSDTNASTEVLFFSKMINTSANRNG